MFLSLSGETNEEPDTKLTDFIKTTKPIEIAPSVDKNLYLCDNGEYVQLTSYCDGKDDCRDASDEANCSKAFITSQRSGINRKSMLLI